MVRRGLRERGLVVSAPKLTPAQERELRLIAEGRTTNMSDFWHGHAFWRRLERRGLAVITTAGFIHITPAGRAALEGAS